MVSKLLIIVLPWLLYAYAAPCQSAPLQKQLRYATFGINSGALPGAQMGIAAILANRHEINIGWQAYFRRSERFPADFDCPSCKHGLGNDIITGGALTYGYVIYPGQMTGPLRIVLRGGILVGQQHIPSNFQKVTNPGPRDDNYTYEYDETISAALLLRPSFDISLSQISGLSVGPYAIISQNLTGGGISFCMMMGRAGHTNLRALRKAARAAKAAKAMEKDAQ